MKTSLDIYLEEDVFILENDGNGNDIDPEFEALAWWKANNLKYQVLFKMVQDILAVHMSSVASESAFSVGGRVIEPHRATLSPKIVEMLLCVEVKKKSTIVISDTFIIYIYFFFFFLDINSIY